MLKLRIALCFAVVVGTLTLTNGILHGARIVTIMYRVAISVVAFGVVGYGIGVIFQYFLEKILLKEITAIQNIDNVSEQQAVNELPNESGFSPFTSDNFQQISRPKE